MMAHWLSARRHHQGGPRHRHPPGRPQGRPGIREIAAPITSTASSRISGPTKTDSH